MKDQVGSTEALEALAGATPARHLAVAERLRGLATQAHAAENRQELSRLASMYEALAAHDVAGMDSSAAKSAPFRPEQQPLASKQD